MKMPLISQGHFHLSILLIFTSRALREEVSIESSYCIALVSGFFFLQYTVSQQVLQC